MNNSLVLRCDYSSLTIHKNEQLNSYVITIHNDHAISSSFTVSNIDLSSFLKLIQNRNLHNIESYISLQDANNFKKINIFFDEYKKVFIEISYKKQFSCLDMLFEFSVGNLNEFISYLKGV
jgi:hypothetical protein